MGSLFPEVFTNEVLRATVALTATAVAIFFIINAFLKLIHWT